MNKEMKIDIMLEAQINYSEKLWKENEKLQQRIDKAIEYIKICEYHTFIEPKKLLEILGDKENE